MTTEPQPVAIPGGLVGGISPQHIEERKRAVQPVYALLALVAVGAVAWTAWQLFR